jgi:hypothetical protein
MNKLKLVDQLPSIEMATDPFVDIRKSGDPAKVAEQLRHAQEQLELTRNYPGRDDKLPSRQ